MAANLVKVGDNLVAVGAKWAEHPRAVSEASDTVITSLPGLPQVKFGD